MKFYGREQERASVWKEYCGIEGEAFQALGA